MTTNAYLLSEIVFYIFTGVMTGYLTIPKLWQKLPTINMLRTTRSSRLRKMVLARARHIVVEASDKNEAKELLQNPHLTPNELIQISHIANEFFVPKIRDHIDELIIDHLNTTKEVLESIGNREANPRGATVNPEILKKILANPTISEEQKISWAFSWGMV